MLTLALPWAGCEYIREMENTLRDGQAQSLLTTTKTIAHSLSYEKDDIFQFNKLTENNTNTEDNVYAYHLNSKIILDGYSDDWGGKYDELRFFNNQIENQQDNSVGIISATNKSYLYLFISVKDSKIIYHKPSEQLVNGDRLQLLIKQKNGKTRPYILQTSAPGEISATYLTGDNTSNPKLKRERRIHGQWQDTIDGYNIEIRIPLKLIHSNINFSIIDIDNEDENNITGWYGTWNRNTNINNGLIIQSSEKLDFILNKFGQDNARLRIANIQGWLIASTGSTTASNLSNTEIKLNETLLDILNQLYRLAMARSNQIQKQIILKNGQLSGDLIENALNKQAGTSWYKPPYSNNAIVSAAFPISINDEVVAVVIADQNSDAILTLTNHALSRLISLSFIAILVSIVGLLGYATFLSIRIRKLRNATDEIISPEGKLTTTFTASTAHDELGDLSRSFSTMHQRLDEYTQYLKSLASKLSHELRTPLAVVQSSLDNLADKNLPDDAEIYAQRAKEGSERLGKIITAMSEASRVEQSIQSSDPEIFNICNVINSSVAAYKDIYPDRTFTNINCNQEFKINGSPELIAQMLDKLIDNAVDFSEDNSEIVIDVKNLNNQIFISVSNCGPLLPETMQTQLFDSMVSIRDKKNDKSHLGLGLYIVKLVVEAHRGSLFAKNRDDKSGVEFVICLPLYV